MPPGWPFRNWVIIVGLSGRQSGVSRVQPACVAPLIPICAPRTCRQSGCLTAPTPTCLCRAAPPAGWVGAQVTLEVLGVADTLRLHTACESRSSLSCRRLRPTSTHHQQSVPRSLACHLHVRVSPRPPPAAPPDHDTSVHNTTILLYALATLLRTFKNLIGWELRYGHPGTVAWGGGVSASISSLPASPPKLARPHAATHDQKRDKAHREDLQGNSDGLGSE